MLPASNTPETVLASPIIRAAPTIFLAPSTKYFAICDGVNPAAKPATIDNQINTTAVSSNFHFNFTPP